MPSFVKGKKTRADHAALLAEAAKYEPRVQRALLKSFDRLREGLTINELAQMVQLRDKRRASSLVDRLDAPDSMVPTTKILLDVFVRGGKVAAEHLP